MSSVSDLTNSPSEDSESDATEYEDDDDKGNSSGWFNPSFYRDWGRDVSQRYNAIVAEAIVQEDDDIRKWDYAPDYMLLSWEITPQTSPDSVISIHGSRSRLWYDRCHWYRPSASAQLSAEIPREYLMPWEQYGSQDGLCYDPPSLEEKKSVSIGISFPRLESTANLRLFFLQPHHGELDSPVSGYLVVSVLFLHSCYIAVRHSRGNPGMRGSMILDGQEIRISKNLEMFLRLIRRTDQVVIIWVRELCVERSELSLSTQRLIENCSCGVLRMDSVMEAADDSGLLLHHDKERKPKLWNEINKAIEEPYHRPVQPSPKELLEIGFDLTYDEIAQLDSYKYVPLDPTVREIRLLTLYSADNFDDPIVVDISHVPLHGGIGYAALSYTWGFETANHYIRACSMKTKITANLDKALRHLRSRLEKGRVQDIWVDALCIDQENQSEKMRQIPRMQEIFENADGVFCWIGETTEVSNITVDFLVEMHTLDEITIFETDDDGEATGTLKQTERLAEAWAQMYKFLKARYFTRKWIVQEVASASLPTLLLGGKNVDSWTRVFNSATLMSRHFDQIFKMWQHFKHPIISENKELETMTHPVAWDIGLDDVNYHLSLVETITYTRQLQESGAKPSLLLLLLLTQNSNCIEPQDRLYSLWALASDSKNLFSRLAYSKSTEELYTAFTKSYARNTGSLDIICAAQLPAAGNTTVRMAQTPCRTIGSIPDLKIPSWCPDWRQSCSVSSLVRQLLLFDDSGDEKARLDIDFPPYHADSFERKLHRKNDMEDRKGHESTPSSSSLHSSNRTPFSFDGSVLIARGVVVDTVRYVSEWTQENCPTTDLTINWLQEAKQHCHRDGASIPRSEIFESCENMWIGEPTGSLKAEWTETVPSEDGGIAEIYKVTAKSEEMKEKLWSVGYAARRAKMIKGRRLVVTEQGRMGLAPWHVRSGFKLAILLGCSVPVLLEEISQHLAEELRMGSFSHTVTNERCSQSLEDTVPGLYFRGDCYLQDCMEGQLLQPFGSTTEEAWAQIRKLPRLRIH